MLSRGAVFIVMPWRATPDTAILFSYSAPKIIKELVDIFNRQVIKKYVTGSCANCEFDKSPTTYVINQWDSTTVCKKECLGTLDKPNWRIDNKKSGILITVPKVELLGRFPSLVLENLSMFSSFDILNTALYPPTCDLHFLGVVNVSAW